MNGIRFFWDFESAYWMEGFANLKLYFVQNHNAELTRDFVCTNGFKLGAWADEQKKQINEIEVNKFNLLYDIGFFYLQNTLDKKWFLGLGQLKMFRSENNHLQVPREFVSKEGFNLANWTKKQRHRKKIGELSQRRVELLDSINFRWKGHYQKSFKHKELKQNTFDQIWMEGFNTIKKFHDRYGHTKVNDDFKALDDFPLEMWITKQRHKKKIGKLSQWRIDRLNSINFVWSLHEFNWHENYGKIIKFYQREGHLKVPLRHKEDGLFLNAWLKRQVENSRSLTKKQLQKLKDIGVFSE